MKKVIALLLLLLALSTGVFAVESNYDNVKGDFKIFCLGDFKDLTHQKYQYLIANQQIAGSSTGNDDFFSTTLLDNQFCVFLGYYHDRLSDITIGSNDYPYIDLDKKIKSLASGLKDIFVTNYGKPTLDHGFPKVYQLKEGSTYTICTWNLPVKTIQLGIAQSRFKFSARIMIYHNELFRALLKEDADNAKNAVKQSTKDF